MSAEDMYEAMSMLLIVFEGCMISFKECLLIIETDE